MTQPTYTSEIVSSPSTEADSIADLALDAAQPREVDPTAIYSVLVPRGAHRETVDLEAFLDHPRRKTGTVALHDAESFAAYVNKHRVEGATTMYADVTVQTIVAILDDASTDKPGWRKHIAWLLLKKTPAWERWVAKDGAMMRQGQFAEHIEDSLPDIQDPPAADMLELAQTFQATSSVTFRSSRLLHSGQQQLQYVEDIDAKAGLSGEITVPRIFTLGIAPFEVGDPYKIEARLRFRIDAGHLTIGYKLDRPEDVLREAFADVVNEVQQRVGDHVLYGTPAS